MSSILGPMAQATLVDNGKCIMRKEHWKGKPFVIKYLALKLDKTHFLQILKNSIKKCLHLETKFNV
jgi:hypothetical protein